MRAAARGRRGPAANEISKPLDELLGSACTL